MKYLKRTMYVVALLALSWFIQTPFPLLVGMAWITDIN